MAQSQWARRVQQFGVLEGGHHGEQGVELGLALRGAGRAGRGERVQRPPYVRESGAGLATGARGAVFGGHRGAPGGPARGALVGVDGDALGGRGHVARAGPGVQGGRRYQQAERPQGTAVAAAREAHRVLGAAPDRAQFGTESGRGLAGAAGRRGHRLEAGRQRLGRPAQGTVVLARGAGAQVTRVGQAGLGSERQLSGQRGHGGLRQPLVLAARHRRTYEAVDAEADGASLGGVPVGGVPPSPLPPLPAPVFSASGSTPRVRKPL